MTNDFVIYLKGKRLFKILIIFSLIFTISLALVKNERVYENNKQSRQKEVTVNNLYNPPRKNIRIVVISDLNSQYGSTEYEPEIDKAIALIPKWQPDLVLCGGDAIAGQKKSLSKSQIDAMWSAFDKHIAAPLRKEQIPFGFTIGNHDGSGAIVNDQLIFQQERELASVYWNNYQHYPGLNFIDKAQFPFYYSFQEQDIFFLVWDASTHIISPQQLHWIEQSLTSKAARQAKMRIAIGHLPLYAVTASKNKPGEYLTEGEKLRSLLEKYQVHTYISGHHHAYYPGKKGQLELLHAGALGQGARQLLNSNLPPRNTVTVVDIELTSSKTIYTTYDIKTLEIIEQDRLPSFIDSHNGRIYRRDIKVK
ncbi:MAG: metallophosphoesterase [Pleurocapsa sp.]